jgi:hypothetical protein
VLASNTTYTAVITVTDANGSPAGATVRFDTYNPVFTWEAEDYDYNNAQTFPDPSTNAFANLNGAAEVDYHENVLTSQNGNPVYRASDPVGLEIHGDAPPRLPWINSGFTDYDVGWNDNGNWNNYTRTFPDGQYNVYVRAANGSAGVGGLSLGRVTLGVGTTTQTTTNIGSFSIPTTGGWQNYTWVPLRDGNGNLAKFIGGAQTVRLTAAGNFNANFYALFPGKHQPANHQRRLSKWSCPVPDHEQVELRRDVLGGSQFQQCSGHARWRDTLKPLSLRDQPRRGTSAIRA